MTWDVATFHNSFESCDGEDASGYSSDFEFEEED